MHSPSTGHGGLTYDRHPRLSATDPPEPRPRGGYRHGDHAAVGRYHLVAAPPRPAPLGAARAAARDGAGHPGGDAARLAARGHPGAPPAPGRDRPRGPAAPEAAGRG